MPEDLRKRYDSRRPILEGLAQALESELREALLGLSHVDRVSFRVKSTESFVTKAVDPKNDPPYQDPLAEIEDQVAGRVIVFFRSDIEAVTRRIEGSFGTVEYSVRRPEHDAQFGYESIHRICLIPPHLKPPGWDEVPDPPTTFELQVRTIFMHAYAEPQHDLAYKSRQDLPRDTVRELAWIAASAWGADHAFERLISRDPA